MLFSQTQKPVSYFYQLSFDSVLESIFISFDLMTDRLTPSVTDRLLVMYGILVHLFYVTALMYSR